MFLFFSSFVYFFFFSSVRSFHKWYACGLSNGFRKLVCLSVGPMKITPWSPSDKSSFETATPMPHASGQSPRGGDRHGPNHISSGALCVELSELTSSIPIGVTGGRELAPRPAEKLSVNSYFHVEFWNCAQRSAAQQWWQKAFLGSSLLPAPFRPFLPPLPPLLSPPLPCSLPPSLFLPLACFLVPSLAPGTWQLLLTIVD